MVTFYLSIFFNKKVEIRCDNFYKMSLKQFMGCYHFNDPNRNLTSILFCSRGANAYSFSSFIGYTVTWTLIIVGFIVGISSFFLITNEYYREIYNQFNITFGLHLLIPFIFLFLSVKFYMIERAKMINGF